MDPVLPRTPKQPESAAPFDYAALDAETAELAREVAERIRSGQRGLCHTIINIGRELILIKNRLGHGEFGRWLAAEFGWSERTAQRFMLVVEMVGDKTDIVSDLPQNILYELSARSTPAPVRENILKRLSSGEKVPAGEIHKIISEARQIAKREAPKLSREQHRCLADKEYRQQSENRDQREVRQEQKASACRRVMDFIISRLNPDAVEELIILMSDAGELPSHHELAKAIGLDMDPVAGWQDAARQRLAKAGNDTSRPSSTPPAPAAKSCADRPETRARVDSGMELNLPAILYRTPKADA